MKYSDYLKREHLDDWQAFELTLVLVMLDKFPELDKALREDKPKGEIVDLIISIRQSQKRWVA